MEGAEHFTDQNWKDTAWSQRELVLHFFILGFRILQREPLFNQVFQTPVQVDSNNFIHFFSHYFLLVLLLVILSIYREILHLI